MIFCSTFLLFCLAAFYVAFGADITPPELRQPSKDAEPAVPAAFADVNGDRFADIILVSSDGRRLLILLGQRDDPVLTYADPIECPWKSDKERIRSVVPGDFDGDETIDIFVTTDTGLKSPEGTPLSRLLTFWGKGNAHFECPKETNETSIIFQDEPLAMDHIGDLIPDLFAIDENGTSVVWTWDKSKHPTMTVAFSVPGFVLRAPHSNAFVDIDGDHHSDLVLTGKDGLHVFPTKHGHHNYSIPWPKEVNGDSVGLTSYVDADADGNIDLLVPACTCERSGIFSWNHDCGRCSDAKLYVRSGASENGEWQLIELTRENATDWVFALEKTGKEGHYLEAITIRVGDYDIDGYPDFLTTMRNTETGEYRVVLCRNIAAAPGSPYPRSFKVDLYTFPRDNTVMGAFFDLRENGLLDVILLQRPDPGKEDYQLLLFENDRPVGYDHYFLKVVVFGPRRENPSEIGEDLSSAATNVAGACVSFVLNDFVGAEKTGKAVQQSQTAHFALQMPYVIFGLADVSNFVETLTVGLPVNQNVTEHRRELSRSWYQLIPNSQVYVIPSPLENPKEWTIKLYITPKHMIGRTLLMLWSLGFAALIIVIIIYWRERLVDKREKRKEAYMMYFSALRG